MIGKSNHFTIHVKCVVNKSIPMNIIPTEDVHIAVGVRGGGEIMSNLRKPTKGEWRVLVEAIVVLISILTEKDIKK